MMDERYAKLKHAPLLLPRARSLPLLLSLLLIACATTQNGREAGSAAQPPPAKTTARDIGTALSAAPEKPPEQSKLYRGTGVLIQGQAEGGARQMATLLEPFVKDQTTVRVDDVRNILILSGTELELKHLLATVEMFDINWMAGMAVGLFTLQSADVKSVVAELEKALGTPDKSPLAGILRIIPIERMNALLIITPQPEYLEEAKKWIERLDKAGTDTAGVRFYVYQVQYSRAERIGPLLQQAFTGRVTQQPTPSAPTLAPGTPAGTIVSAPSYQAAPTSAVPVVPPTPTQTATQAASAAAAAAAATRAVTIGDGSGVIRNVQVVADKDNNTVLIVATPTEYAV